MSPARSAANVIAATNAATGTTASRRVATLRYAERVEQAPRVTRDAAWNEREFGREKWPAVAALIEEACTVETPARLSRVVQQVGRRERDTAARSLVEQDAVVGGASVRVPRTVAVGAYQALIVETVVEACSDGVDLVVELGSGWSRNLFLAWLAGAPAGALYVGAEFTEAGRNAANRVARLEPAIRFQSIPFDYHAPDLEAIAGHRSAVVFTVHSADYAPQLNPAVFEAIRGAADRVTCVHFENFGWQVSGADTACADYARVNDYNRDLYALLRGEQRAGRLELGPVLVDVVGLHSRYRTSVAVWHAGQ